MLKVYLPLHKYLYYRYSYNPIYIFLQLYEFFIPEYTYKYMSFLLSKYFILLFFTFKSISISVIVVPILFINSLRIPFRIKVSYPILIDNYRVIY